MRLLFDQNISRRILRIIEPHFPGSTHVVLQNLESSKDSDIWEYARANDYHIVTFDSDFIDLSQVKGIPPKIIWLRSGNSTTLNIANQLISKKEEINEFLNSRENRNLHCLVIRGLSREI